MQALHFNLAEALSHGGSPPPFDLEQSVVTLTSPVHRAGDTYGMEVTHPHNPARRGRQ